MTFDYEINATFPAPKANSLDKIAAVVDVVNVGCDTGEAIADALDIENREGSYYGDAAGYLGLVESVSGEAVKTYALTPSGHILLALDPLSRVDYLHELLQQTPLVQVYAESGNDGVMDSLINDYGYAEDTSVRRAATIASWHRQAASGATLGASVALTVGFANGRAGAAAKAAAEARKARIAAAVPVIKSYGICTDCFMDKSAAGTCGC